LEFNGTFDVTEARFPSACETRVNRLVSQLPAVGNARFVEGNILDRLPVFAFQTFAQFEAATAQQREQAILVALDGNKSQRTLYSPAEAINILIIGAAHSGSAFNGALPADRFDPFTTEDAPNVATALGLGYKKTVKPDLLLSEGRTPVRLAASLGTHIEINPHRVGKVIWVEGCCAVRYRWNVLRRLLLGHECRDSVGQPSRAPYP
jgi:hypothetical protein